MISITLAAALAAATAQAAGPPSLPRKNYSACLQKVIKDKREANLSTEGFTAAAKADCAAQEAAFRASLVAADLKMGLKKADAEEGAELQVEEYVLNAADTYSIGSTGNSKTAKADPAPAMAPPATPAATPAVTPASAPAQPQ
jgi:hypothetical protein